MRSASSVQAVLATSTSPPTNDCPPGVGGGGDDADIYSWNGGSPTPACIDASALGWSTANVDGFVRVDATHFYLSYSADTTVPVPRSGPGRGCRLLQRRRWSVYFDGTGARLDRRQPRYRCIRSAVVRNNINGWRLKMIEPPATIKVNYICGKP